jgi:hypothetical protein
LVWKINGIYHFSYLLCQTSMMSVWNTNVWNFYVIKIQLKSKQQKHQKAKMSDNSLGRFTLGLNP